MSEITKLYENAGIKVDRIICYRGFDNCIDNDFNCHCHNEKPCKDAAKIYPPFTAEKQIYLIKFLSDKAEYLGIHYDRYKGLFEMQTDVGGLSIKNEFEEALASRVNYLWQDLTSEEKQQVKGILK